MTPSYYALTAQVRRGTRLAQAHASRLRLHRVRCCSSTPRPRRRRRRPAMAIRDGSGRSTPTARERAWQHRRLQLLDVRCPVLRYATADRARSRSHRPRRCTLPRSVRPLHERFSRGRSHDRVAARSPGRRPAARRRGDRSSASRLCSDAARPRPSGRTTRSPLHYTRTAPVDLSLNEGDRLAIRAPTLSRTPRERCTIASRQMYFSPRDQGTISVELPLNVRISPIKPGAKLTMCR